MKKIGILGGMSPESSLDYYRLLIERAKEREPEGRYPELIIYNLNFEEFCRPATEGKDEEVISLLRNKLVSLERAGADFIIIASNTPHMYYEEIKGAISIPILSIVEATAEVAEEYGLSKVGLLGTKFTMTGDFYPGVFAKENIEITVPEPEDRELVHDKIMNELVNGDILDSTRKKLVEVIKKMRRSEGIEAVILGCTELPLILSEEDTGFPVLNTTQIHVDAAYSLAAD